MKIPEPSYSIAALIDKSHEERTIHPRPHMGCSLLGHPCDRWLWLNFRWAVVEKFPGRMLRLFRRGQLEETTVVQDLRAIGINVQKTGVSQSRVDFGCHVSGSVDGLIEFGVPESPNKKHILEIKTHSSKSFNDLEKNGVEKSKPMHYVQMQMYMTGMKVDRALYVAVCKDDDRIYTERVKLDKNVAQKAIERGHRLVKEERMPPPLSTDPTWFECRFCAAHEFCHKTKLTKEVNCRTCCHSTPKEDGTWHCASYDVEIPTDNQRDGCNAHVLHPDLVPWSHEFDGQNVIWITPEGKIKNGEKDGDVYESTEIVTNYKACLQSDDFIKEMRDTFGGKVVG